MFMGGGRGRGEVEEGMVSMTFEGVLCAAKNNLGDKSRLKNCLCIIIWKGTSF